jgi:hypothetical protein
MNLANSYYQEPEFEYQTVERRSVKDDKTPRRNRASYSRTVRPAVHNGIHRRRNKRFAW